MGDKTSIEWTRGDDGTAGATWNPMRGCSRVSEGCRNCYAERVAARFSGQGEAATQGEAGGPTREEYVPPQPYAGFATMTPSGPRWTGVVKLVPSMLDAPLHWRKPRRIFVNSMSDLFHEALSNEDIAAVFGVMAACPQHTFQILTKRAKRMREWMTSWATNARLNEAIRAHDLSDRVAPMFEENDPSVADMLRRSGVIGPLNNVWLGVSVEDQATADERIPELLATPAAVRFVSYEPALAWANLRGHFLSSPRTAECVCGHGHGFTRCPNTGGVADPCHHRTNGCTCTGFRRIAGEGISWCIVGGESGPNARSFDLAWARQTIAACRAANVKVFLKQLGARCMTDDGGYVVGAGGDWPSGSRIHVGATMEAPRWVQFRDRKGGDMSEWPNDLRVRETPR